MYQNFNINEAKNNGAPSLITKDEKYINRFSLIQSQ